MKKILIVIILPIFLFFLSILISNVQFLNDVKCLPIGKAFEKHYDFVQIALISVLVFGFIQWYNLSSSIKRIENLDLSIYHFIRKEFEGLSKDFHYYSFRFNIMIPEKRFFVKLEPSEKKPSKLKTSLFPTVFKIKFHFGMDFQSSDHAIEMTLNQGVVGEVFQTKKMKVVAFSDKTPEFNLNETQKKLVSDLTVLISIPIYSYDFKSNDLNLGKVIGILNIDSTSEEAYELINSGSDINSDKYKIFNDLLTHSKQLSQRLSFLLQGT